MSYTHRQWYVTVFRGDRATDLVAVFAVVATDRGSAIQQAWDYVRERWRTEPQALEYLPIPLPAFREPRWHRKGRELR